MRKLTIQGQYFSRNLFPLPIYSHLHSFSEFYVLLDNQTLALFQLNFLSGKGTKP